MAKIGIDMGHCLSGNDSSAVGIVSESKKDREIGFVLISKLQSLGHTVVNCTVDYANSVNESLQARVNKANSNNVDVFVSIHLNAGTGGYGVETWVYGLGGKAEQYARNVQNQLVSLGYRDRGIKAGNLYVIRHTSAPAILVECGFVDSQEDCNRFNADAIANCICKGITGKTSNITPTPQPTPQPNNNQGGFKDMNIQYKNGSTPEICYADENLTVKVGSLDPYEVATQIGVQNGKPIILYNTPNGKKVAFVKYNPNGTN